MTYAAPKTPPPDKTAMVVVKLQQSPSRGPLWRVCLYVFGMKLMRPGFQKRKPAIKLAAMMVQQMLIHGWKVSWQVLDEKGNDTRTNLAALGSKMERGEKKKGG